MRNEEFYKLPRLYVDAPLKDGDSLPLSADHAHYLRNVMRKSEGDQLRLFNGRDGEALATLSDISKKAGAVETIEILRPQPLAQRRIHLLFTPLEKKRLDMVIEKTVELGVTDLHPVITERTQHRSLNDARVRAQIIEAAEQSERLTLPALHAIKTLTDTVQNWGLPKIQWGCERPLMDRQPLGACRDMDQAFLIGPVGGFTRGECDWLAAQDNITPIILSENILRAETAAIICVASVISPC